MDIDQAFAQIRSAFPSTAILQGTHFKFAQRGEVTILEIRRSGRFFYWLIANGEARAIHASVESKLAPMRTFGESFKPSAEYRTP